MSEAEFAPQTPKLEEITPAPEQIDANLGLGQGAPQTEAPVENVAEAQPRAERIKAIGERAKKNLKYLGEVALGSTILTSRVVESSVRTGTKVVGEATTKGARAAGRIARKTKDALDVKIDKHTARKQEKLAKKTAFSKQLGAVAIKGIDPKKFGYKPQLPEPSNLRQRRKTTRLERALNDATAGKLIGDALVEKKVGTVDKRETRKHRKAEISKLEQRYKSGEIRIDQLNEAKFRVGRQTVRREAPIAERIRERTAKAQKKLDKISNKTLGRDEADSLRAEQLLSDGATVTSGEGPAISPIALSEPHAESPIDELRRLRDEGFLDTSTPTPKPARKPRTSQPSTTEQAAPAKAETAWGVALKYTASLAEKYYGKGLTMSEQSIEKRLKSAGLDPSEAKDIYEKMRQAGVVGNSDENNPVLLSHEDILKLLEE